MKILTLSFIFMFTVLLSSAQKVSFYSFKTKTIDGQVFDFSSLKGKKVLVVNTASKCGNTPQYEGLETLYKKYGPDKFVIIGFPANNFGGQEPGTNAEIKQFCTDSYHVTFPMMQKISVKGDDMDPIYKWLTTKTMNGKMDADVSWNFQKFMVDEKGNLVDFASPRTKPDDEKISKWLQGN